MAIRFFVIIELIALLFWGCSLKVERGGEINSAFNRALVFESEGNSDCKITLGEIKFFTWWWKDEDVKMGLPEIKPPKTEYVEMTRWAFDHGEGGNVYPDKFDIVVPVENKCDRAQTIHVRFVVSYKVEKVKTIMGLRKDNETLVELHPDEESAKRSTIENRLSKTQWTNEQEIFFGGINLASSKGEPLTVHDYDIRGFLNQFYEGKNKSWPWLMKVRVQVENSDGALIVQKYKILEIIPGD